MLSDTSRNEGLGRYCCFCQGTGVLAGVGILFAVGGVCSLPGDVLILGWLHTWDVPGDLNKAINLSEVFAHGMGAAAILGSILLVSRERRSAVLFAILLTAISGLTANALKISVVRIRPHSVGEIEVRGVQPSTPGTDREIVEPSFWDSRQRSFPSGHAATAWGLAIGLSLTFPRGMWLFGFLAVLACVQRLTSDAHYPSDVLAGGCIAFAWGAILLNLPFTRRLLGR